MQIRVDMNHLFIFIKELIFYLTIQLFRSWLFFWRRKIPYFISIVAVSIRPCILWDGIPTSLFNIHIVLATNNLKITIITVKWPLWILHMPVRNFIFYPPSNDLNDMIKSMLLRMINIHPAFVIMLNIFVPTHKTSYWTPLENFHHYRWCILGLDLPVFLNPKYSWSVQRPALALRIAILAKNFSTTFYTIGKSSSHIGGTCFIGYII